MPLWTCYHIAVRPGDAAFPRRHGSHAIVRAMAMPSDRMPLPRGWPPSTTRWGTNGRPWLATLKTACSNPRIAATNATLGNLPAEAPFVVGSQPRIRSERGERGHPESWPASVQPDGREARAVVSPSLCRPRERERSMVPALHRHLPQWA